MRKHLKILTKNFHPYFLIVKSSNWQDSYTTYPEISAKKKIDLQNDIYLKLSRISILPNGLSQVKKFVFQ